MLARERHGRYGSCVLTSARAAARGLAHPSALARRGRDRVRRVPLLAAASHATYPRVTTWNNRAQEVRLLRAQKLRLERRLAEADTPTALTREARRIGYVKPGERLFIVKGIAAWRRLHERSPR